MIPLLVFLLLIPVGMVIFGLFKPFYISFRTNADCEYCISFGYEITGYFQSYYWFTIEKIYYNSKNEIEFVDLLFKFWEGKRYWEKRNETEYDLEKEYFDSLNGY